MIDYIFEKGKLYDLLGKSLIEILKETKSMIAGGTITSLFCNREVNDIDIYFRNKDEFIKFIYIVWEDGKWVISHTTKSTLFIKDTKQIQMIHFKFFENAEDIFKTFDFITCMGCFDFATETFILHDDFMKHNAQRILEFNPNTSFPIVSALRVQKYERKGYKISKTEYLKIILACMKLEINSYKDLKEQMGGMYGINYDKIFDENEEYSLDNAITKLSDLHLNEDYFKKPEQLKFDDADDIIDNVLNEERQYFILNSNTYKINKDGTIRSICQIYNNLIKVEPSEYIKDKKIYKFVKKVNEKYYSFYDRSFEYVLNKIVIAKNTSLYCGFIEGAEDFTYSNDKNAVLIELEIINIDDINCLKDNYRVEIKQAKFIREVPESEWKNMINKKKSSSEIFDDPF